MGFQGISTALTALYANRQALDVTGNNIANVNTEGYTRQRVEQSASSLFGTSSSYWSTGPRPGVGVTVDNIQRLRDQFLETASLTAHSGSGAADTLSKTFETIESAFGEPSDTGIQDGLTTFWQSFDDVNTAAGANDELAARSSVIENARTLVTQIRQVDASLSKLSSDSIEQIKAGANELNSLAKNIADLNSAIQSQSNAGVTPNELMDKRDQLIRQMSDIADVTVTPTTGNSVQVQIGGVAIVNNNRVTRLEVDASTTPVKLGWDADNDATTLGGNPVTLRSGKLAGLMETANVIVPKYKSALNEVATTLISTVNTQNAAGVDKYGNPGGNFFSGTSAANIDLDAAMSADSNLIAAGTAANGGTDGENARIMANLSESLTGTDAKYRALINLLGTDAARATNQSKINTTITTNADGARDSVSGVNLDEEMTNMIQFQNAYSASARYLSTMNQVLDSLLSIV